MILLLIFFLILFHSCTVGTVIPVYSTFKAIENKDQNEQQKWLLYWTGYPFMDLLVLLKFPLYYHAKFAFLVWLQLPSSNGAKHLYKSHLRPFLLRHQATFDKILEFINSEMSKLVSARQAEIKFARTLILKLMASVNQIVWYLIHPMQTPQNRSIEGRRQVDSSDTQSNSED
ncbi:hypothetical protein CXB51_004525 [Gossypium anomalum]|uniref:HVA22-like protein n=1 Tax=Gossypium anomalum TaxID=47600 RepID=A0A8J6D9A2_9ROSI|nr:hypothetical protein CXB51_004525 [Gossypium anomalum]